MSGPANCLGTKEQVEFAFSEYKADIIIHCSIAGHTAAIESKLQLFRELDPAKLRLNLLGIWDGSAFFPFTEVAGLQLKDISNRSQKESCLFELHSD
ncbi:Uncharacterised protein [Mycobacteroides abscessus subsp. abscessus]|nr:Uncharacterised protein [Mycobacteroides abscessus subsp. abscessus]